MRQRTTSAAHWAAIDAQRTRLAQHRTDQNQRHGAAVRQVEALADLNTTAPLPADASEPHIAAMADRRAELMTDRIVALDRTMDLGELLDWLNAQALSLQALRPFRITSRGAKPADQVAGFIKRLQEPAWWRRQIKVEVTRRAELQAIRQNLVSAKRRQWYCSTFTVKRRQARSISAEQMMESCEIENEQGDRFTLKAVRDKSPSHKPIRRGELMTRIKGCEEWAMAEGLVGLFLTLTVPSRYHSTLHGSGLPNPAYDGSSPREAQQWLRDCWADARSKLRRAGIRPYGFRVAEPHHDGCPHWHALVWMPREEVYEFKRIVRAWWLRDAGDEPGADRHRVKIKRMRGGEAVGYVAKYVAKNIDDDGSVQWEGHSDDWAGIKPGDQAALFEDGAKRVEAWASCWGIRQFQAIGQPPVTVWREARRVPVEVAAGLMDHEGRSKAPRIALLLDAVNRADEQLASWAGYLDMQGGPNLGRDYLVRIARMSEIVEGRYEAIERAVPVGLFETGSPETLVESVRHKWRPVERRTKGPSLRQLAELRRVAAGLGVELKDPRGSATGGPMRRDSAAADRSGAVSQCSRSAPPWTRVNNCARGGFGSIVDSLLARIKPEPLVPEPPWERWPGGPPGAPSAF